MRHSNAVRNGRLLAIYKDTGNHFFAHQNNFLRLVSVHYEFMAISVNCYQNVFSSVLATLNFQCTDNQVYSRGTSYDNGKKIE